MSEAERVDCSSYEATIAWEDAAAAWEAAMAAQDILDAAQDAHEATSWRENEARRATRETRLAVDAAARLSVAASATAAARTREAADMIQPKKEAWNV